MAGIENSANNNVRAITGLGTTNPASTTQVAVTPAISTGSVTTGLMINPVFTPSSGSLLGKQLSVQFQPGTGISYTVYGLSIAPTITPGGTGVVTSAYGLNITGSALSASITTAYSLYVSSATGSPILNNYTALFSPSASALVGVGTTTPAYALDVNGAVNATRVYAGGTTADNQLITLAEGYNQGGFGGGSVGTQKPMSVNSYTIMNLSQVNSGSRGFFSQVFDGRYIYLVPDRNNIDPGGFDGLITRYDTTQSFISTNSYTAFNLRAVNANARGFASGAFDGRYVYLFPVYEPSSTLAQANLLCRYDTNLSFFASGSYTTMDPNQMGTSGTNYYGAVFDGRYIYAVPSRDLNASTFQSGTVLRYDTTQVFTSLSSFTVFNLSFINSSCQGFWGGAYDGRYVYFIPRNFAYFTRYDTTLSFFSSTSFTAYNLQQVNTGCIGFIGGVFDGQYIYFVPYNNVNSGLVTRYDTTQSFFTAASYTTFNTVQVNSQSFAFFSGCYDGRYVYFFNNRGGNSGGVITQYDTTESFLSSSSYTTFDSSQSNSLSYSMNGCMYDGKYIYIVFGYQNVPNAFLPYYGRLDAYPGPEATSTAAFQAPNGFAIGAYAGVNPPPSGGLIVSGNVGIGTSSPAYTLDVNGTINATNIVSATISSGNVYATGGTTRNQLVTLDEGYSTGSLVGTNKLISLNNYTIIDLSKINTASRGYYGEVFDGRYIYLVPDRNNIDPGAYHGLITRYDTTQSFISANSYTAYNLRAVNANARGFQTGAFDGRYVYMFPIYEGQSGFPQSNLLCRYDTTQSFTASSSYTTMNPDPMGTSHTSYWGAVFDGRYVYAVPSLDSNFATNFSGTVLQYDTSQSFTAYSSFTVFNLSFVNSNSQGFVGGAYDGRYVYFIPRKYNYLTRYDTTLSFNTSTSFTAYNLQQVNTGCTGFLYGGMFDGKYIYFTPNNSGTSGLITRYDTTLSFTTATSYTTFDVKAQVSNQSYSFGWGCFDGRYVYFFGGGSSGGVILSYDTTRSFLSASSYTTIDTTKANSSSYSMSSSLYDGKYIYITFGYQNGPGAYLPAYARFDAYPGPQATSIAANQAPNGLSVGAYAGTAAAPLGGLIVSGSVGIGTATPAYSLDVNGTINALNVIASNALSTNIYATGGTTRNQLITLAQGYDQGGFGSGLVGTNKQMSGNSTTCFNTASLPAPAGGWGGGFDGRYIYLVYLTGSYIGVVVRYDTTIPFNLSSSYTTFNLLAIDAACNTFWGATFDGRYMYFASASTNGNITRYDTTLSFTATGSYTVINATKVNSNCSQFDGGIFDGRYIYFVEDTAITGSGNDTSYITQYDTAQSFTSPGSYTVFRGSSINSLNHQFSGGTFDGRYVYFAPDWPYQGFTRYDTTLPFNLATSFTTFVVSGGNRSAIFDGRYVYLIPHFNGSAYGVMIRYDTTLSFTASSSYFSYDVSAVNTNCRQLLGGVFDGRYLWFPTNINGYILQYDTTKQFNLSTSYTALNTTNLNSLSVSFAGAVFDGRYVYFLPSTQTVITRIDAYPGPQATAIAANQAPNGFVVGSYVGANASPVGGLIVSGTVGIGTQSPQYTLDVNGTINATNLFTPAFHSSNQYATGGTTRNQLITLAQGYNQGGYGGGSVGMNKQMSANSITCFDTAALPAPTGYNGGVFDGRYIYNVNFNGGAGNIGKLLRYDTTLSFISSSSYTIFNMLAVDSNSGDFTGGTFDGRYVYFASQSSNGYITRYDTTLSFTAATSYTVFSSHQLNSNLTTFLSGIFDGHYIYFVSNANAYIIQYNTAQSFTSVGSYTTFNAVTINSANGHFYSGTFDGRYVYFAPDFNTTGFTRYDTTLPFTTPTSYTTFVTSGGTRCANFDGRYIYLTPHFSGGAYSILTRYDTYQSFTAASSYSSFNLALVNTNVAQLLGAAFDGRYLYFAPDINSYICRYDTTLSFNLVSSYTVIISANFNSKSTNFVGVLYDGRYVYFLPFNNTVITRIDAYPGPQATAIAANQAPNGFVVGSYAGANTAPLNSLIVSGSVGIGTVSPQYTLDVNGTINAGSIDSPLVSNVYATGGTTRNQLITLAQGYNQGGYGGGSVGTNKQMSANSITCFDMKTVNSANNAFFGAAFDGRYIYFVPAINALIARYDTTSSFINTSSYTSFNILTVNSNASLYSGGLFDGRYVYFIPGFTQPLFLRYDTTLSFFASSSYTTFALLNLNSRSNSFNGGIFDGQYIYLVPSGSFSGLVTRYDTAQSFTVSNSYTTFQTQQVSKGCGGFFGGVFDGQYVYFAPLGVAAYFSGTLTRYDTTQSFLSAASYTTFDLTVISRTARGFRSAVFDGRYVYLIPATSNSSEASHGTVVRYDTQGSFLSTGSYTTFTLTLLSSNARGYMGGVYDGRYVYFAPYNNGSYQGNIVWYDTTSSFISVSSYSILDLTKINSNSAGFAGAILDGRYIYLIPSTAPSGVSGLVTRIDAYPGPQATAIAANQAPNGLSIGAYAGTAASLGTLIVSGSVGIGTTSPAYTLDVSNTINVAALFSQNFTVPNQNLYATGGTTRNQLINLAEGYSQGGYGGGSVGTNKQMSANSATCYNTQNINIKSVGFIGGIFDGRFIYFMQYFNGAQYAGLITRYDTTLSFVSDSSYTTFDTQIVNTQCNSFAGGAFDGRYVYFVPLDTYSPNPAVTTRYDTTLSFTATSSYTTFATFNIYANARGFRGAVFDGRYIYFIPNAVPGVTWVGLITRYDTTLSFTNTNSYTTFDATGVASSCKGFEGGAFDGRFVYCVPFNGNGGSASSVILQYDTTLSFLVSTSYTAFDLLKVSNTLLGFRTAVFDGRYIYFVPNNSNTSGNIARYDTTRSFLVSASYTAFNLQQINNALIGFRAAEFDGRYVYFVPDNNGSSGNVARYDTTFPFNLSASYTAFNTTEMNSNSKGFSSGVFDGRYVYLVPYYNGSYFGQITRIDAYPGSQATAIATNQAPNGFVIGSYVGANAAPLNGLIVSGSVGIGTASPQYTLDVNGIINATNVIASNVSLNTSQNQYATGGTTRNQLITLAEGYNQGGFGGGSVGTKNLVSANSITCFNLLTVNSNSNSFYGGAFDGRYVYFAPYNTYYLTRYDTTLSFFNSASFSAFNLSPISGSAIAFSGAAFDGRYIYLVPDGFSGNLGLILRYDTSNLFNAASSYATFNLLNNDSTAHGFGGGIFDGRYVYFVPYSTNTLARYDTSLPFSSSSSFTTFNMAKVNSSNTQFSGGAFDGRYIYLSPFNSLYVFLRYDTTLSFYLPTSYTTFDVSALNASARIFYWSSVFDGRFIYFTPTSAFLLRYDTTLSFTASSSYTLYNLTNVSTSGYLNSIYDGRYVYLLPGGNGTGSVITLYDTTQPFVSINSYTAFDAHQANNLSHGFFGAVFDGQYIYLVPAYTGSGLRNSSSVTRITAYPGPQATAIAASQAPNGLAVGSYVGSVSPNFGDVLVSGIVGVNQSSPQFALDIVGVMDATSVNNLQNSANSYATGGTTRNQLISLAEGYNQGGFGGGSVGTNKTMSANSTTVFDLAKVNSASNAFLGGVFDGRYIYFVPNVYSALFVRYDTTQSFFASSSYTTFDFSPLFTSTLIQGGVFDGRYVYLLGQANTVIPRYDTTLPFTSLNSYASFNVATLPLFTFNIYGGVFDGRYIYFALDQDILRYDPTMPFVSAGSYAAFNLAQPGVYTTCIFDGRYIYFANNGSLFNQILRYDTTQSFGSAASYTTFGGYDINGACFDGRYVYFFTEIPSLVRYDTTSSFNGAASYVTSFVPPGPTAGGCVFDGRYVYLINTSFASQIITRYDTTQPFSSAGSYASFDLLTVKAGILGNIGGIFDGRYVYITSITTSFIVRLDAYPGPQATAIAVSQAPNGFAVGSYAGTTTLSNISVNYNALIISGNLGVNTSSPQYTVDVNGTVNATTQIIGNIIDAPVPGLTTNNQLAALSQGYNQGGYGGGSVGTNQQMSANSTTCFDTTTINLNSKGFNGGVFDGRYVYLVPNLNGQITRYDTSLSFLSPTAYTTFDTTGVNSNSHSFVGGVFDGRYVYLVPNQNGQITRYDTSLSFVAAASYATFDMKTLNANSFGFTGGIFDGRYVYLVPNVANLVVSGQITQYDTTGSFFSAASYTTFDTTQANANSEGFSGGVFDGRYVYLVPNFNIVYSGQITRYDTAQSFVSVTSYTTFDTAQLNTQSAGFKGGVFDGRYVYLVPNFNGFAQLGQITRYDTTLSFTIASSYATFDTTQVDANSVSFFGGVFDGRYVYLVPATNNGQITRYDTTRPFLLPTSYTVFNTTGVNGNSKGFTGGVFDGRYVYLVPYGFPVVAGLITRIEAYTGPQATAIAASSAPNGFAIGSYAGSGLSNNASYYNALIVSGNVGIGLTTPTFSLHLAADSAGQPSSSTWTTPSDIRIKKNIQDISNALDTICQLRPRQFQYSPNYAKDIGADPHEIHYGFVADEVESVLDGCVLPSSVPCYGGKMKEWFKSGATGPMPAPIPELTNLKALNIHNILIFYIQAIKELAEIEDTLQQKINNLKNKTKNS